MSDEKYLTFALGKGRLANNTLDLMEKIGITCTEIRDKDSRKLIFVNDDLKLKFFLAKGPDVPTYVEYGAADIGVVGKDTLLEERRRAYEVLDLGFGKCRMCVCGPESAREKLEHREMIRVASKYPVIARDYFNNRKFQTVDIIKLNGSVELGPIVGLSDVIVDIVETGSLLLYKTDASRYPALYAFPDFGSYRRKYYAIAELFLRECANGPDVHGHFRHCQLYGNGN